MEEIPVKTGDNQETRNDKGQFVPGVSGNPAGKPVGSKSFTTKVKEALAKIADGKDYTYEEALVKAVMKKAIVDQDPKMIQLIWNYLDGKPTQKTVIDFGDQKIEESLDLIKEAITDESKKDSTNIPSGGEAIDNNTDTGINNGCDSNETPPKDTSDTPDPIRKEN